MDPPQEICGFEFVSKRELPKSDMTSLLYKHKVHGCPFVYLKTKDSHNFFSCTFRTAPIDNSGRSHMLEHLVLSGTQKYPLKELFSEMLKRSFATLMNAFTANQWTSFPFSTINKHDYFNILDVYLDSCFHPQLSPVVFMSECFHTEFEDNDPTKPLINSGVVYNEMRGSLNSSIQRVIKTLQENIFPDSPERFFSGGVPECIAKSTINDIRDHHARYYHPSNAMFYHYGNIPIEEVFAKVNEVISAFPVSNWHFSTSIFKQPKWTKPKRIEIEDAFDPMLKDKTRQYRVLVSYLTDPWKDLIVHNDIDFLTDLLTRGDSSPIYKAIIKSGLAVKYFANGFSDDTYNTCVTFGFEGIAEADVEKVISIVQETLEKCYKEGFKQERYDALIHENELYSHELSNNMGYKYFFNVVTSLCYEIDPHANLDTDFYIKNIRDHIKENPKYYQEMIKPTFLDNNHKLITVVKPVEGFVDRINEKIKEDLAEQKSKLSQDQINLIVKNYETLKESQKNPQPVELLPSIKKSDIQLEGEYDHLTKTEDDVSILAIPLNGMTYIDIDLKVDFTHQLFKYLPLLTYILDKVGAGEMDEDQLEVFSKLHCKEIRFDISEQADLDNSENGYARITMSTHCLDRNIDKTIKILNMILFDPHLRNPERIKSLLKRRLNELNETFQYRGDYLLRYVVPSNLTGPCAIRNVIKGSYQLQFLNELIEKNDINDLCNKLEEAYKEILLRSKPRAFIHTMDVNSPVISYVKEILKRINAHRTNVTSVSSPIDKSLFENYKNAFIETESSTNFTSIACKTASYKDESSPLYIILSKIMTNEFLHDMVRVDIGAYGVWAIQNVELGIYEIDSFRDPSPTKCLEAFEKALDICANEENITDDMVERAIMKVFSDFDSPESPSNKGYLDYDGKPKDLIQKRRNSVYNATKQQIVEIAKFLKEKNWNHGMFSNSSVLKPPEGYTTIKLNE